MSNRKYKVVFRRSRDEPKEEKEFDFCDQANSFAIRIEMDGGIALVLGEVKSITLATPFYSDEYYE
jgi:hypothetical protein